MTSAATTWDLLAPEQTFDLPGIAGFERVKAIYDVDKNSVVVTTIEGREIRISAWRDRGTGQYVSDFERRATVTSGEQRLHVWSATPAYERCYADDAAGCLEAAILEVDRVHVS